MVTLWKGWFTYWNSRELVCVRASFCWAQCAVMGGRGQWPVSFSSSTDIRGSFCSTVSHILRVLLFMSILSLWNNSGDACKILFSLFDGWNLSLSQYYISVSTFNLILESCLVTFFHEGVIACWDMMISLKWERRGCSYLDCFLEASRLTFLKSVPVQAELACLKNMLTAHLHNIRKLFQLRKVLCPPAVQETAAAVHALPLKRSQCTLPFWKPVSSGTAASQCVVTHAQQAAVLQTEARMWRNKILSKLKLRVITALIKTALLFSTKPVETK